VTAPDEAREILELQQFDAVMLDIHLPTDDIGWQFVQEIRRVVLRPVIIYANAQHRQRAQKEGIPFVEKPSRPFTLIKTINATLQPEAERLG
jgi:CheY-like chemotaxis protein